MADDSVQVRVEATPLGTDPESAARWDALVHEAWNATFMHTRRFLSYHGERFEDRSLVLHDPDGVWLGVLPAAVDPDDPGSVVSHAGLSYGGIAHAGRLRGERMDAAFDAIAARWRPLGHRRLVYKVTPWFYHRVPAADDVYALQRRGARLERCDLTSLVDLAARPQPSGRRRRCLRRARAAGVSAAQVPDRAAELWAVLDENLERRHGRSPVHSLDEIERLRGWFPGEIELHAALHGDRIEAGMVLFCSPQTVHAQYIASSPTGFELSALDVVVEHCVERARERGARFFDFGISTEQAGRRLNEGLYRFKNEFGAGSAVHEFFALDL